MKIKNLLLASLILVSSFAFATPEDAAKIFKPELREDAVAYMKSAENEDRILLKTKFASLLNKEFNKEIVYLKKLESGRALIQKKMELTPKEKEKLKNIIITLTPEVTQKRTAGPLGEIKREFDLYDEVNKAL